MSTTSNSPASAPTPAPSGARQKALTLAGLAVQLACFAAFTVLAIWTHRHPK